MTSAPPSPFDDLPQMLWDTWWGQTVPMFWKALFVDSPVGWVLVGLVVLSQLLPTPKKRRRS